MHYQIRILTILLILLVLSSFAFGQPRRPPTPRPNKESAKGWDTGEATKTTTYYSIQPIELSADNLPPNYHGHNPQELYNELVRRKSREVKDEFETTESYRLRLQSDLTKPVLGQLSVSNLFAFEIAPTDATYDADQQSLAAFFKIGPVWKGASLDAQRAALAGKLILGQDRSYTGTNAFGASINVEVLQAERFDISFPVDHQFPEVDYLNAAYKSMLKSKAFGVYIKIDPTTAKQLKTSIRLLAICKLREPFTTNGTIYRKPTFDHPTETFFQHYYLNTELVELWYYDISTGDILLKVKPDSAPK